MSPEEGKLLVEVSTQWTERGFEVERAVFRNQRAKCSTWLGRVVQV